MTRPTAAEFADGPFIDLGADGGADVATNTPTTLQADTRYARATTIQVTGPIAPSARVTFTATAGNAWTTRRVKDARGHMVAKPPSNQAPATAAELRQLRWRVHCGGELLVDQGPGQMGDAVTLTLPARLAGETVLAGAYNELPLVAFFQAWWIEDAREPGGKRSGRGTRLENVDQLARIMGYQGEGDPAVRQSYVRDAFAPLVAGFARATMDTLQQAHFLAQVAHETGRLQALREQRSDASAGAAYATSNGNQGPADGAAFKGRGVLQTTGYDGYKGFFAAIDHAHDLSHETLRRRAQELERLPSAVDAGLYFWRTKKCDERAALDDALGVSIRVNGWNRPSYLPNHYRERLTALQRAKRELGITR